MYERVAYLLPKSYKKGLKQLMVYSGVEERQAERFAGFSVLFSLGLFLVVFFDLWIFGFGLLALAAGLAVGALFIITAHLSLILIVDSRARQIEMLLPDALLLIAANIRAGMTVDKAIWLSARPEFGLLEEEIRKIGARTLGGKSLKDSLRETTKKVRSQVLERAIKLLVQGIESGEELAHLLEETASNIRVSQALRKEIQSNVMMYSIFIMFAAVIGAPVLFAISLFFVEVTEKLWLPHVTTAGGALAGAVQFVAPVLTSNELFWFAAAYIILTTFFGALIIGLIQQGEEKRGIRYIPVFTLLALAIFVVAKYLITAVFGGFVYY